MTLLPDWKDILKKAFSVWAFYAIAVLSAVETLFAMNSEALNKSMPPGTFSLTVGIISALGIWLRVGAQKKAEEIGGNGEDER